METFIWAIDPGDTICGVVQLVNNRIGYCFNEKSSSVYRKIMSLSKGHKFIVVIEDILPYAMRLTPEIISTCKFIGELSYRFRTSKQVTSVEFVARNSVKKWIFDTCPDIVLPRVEKKMATTHERKIKKGLRGLIKKDGTPFSPSFQYVDDRIIIAAIKSIYNIPTPKPGKPNIFGLVDHSWQALAAGACYANNSNKNQ